MWSNAVSNDRGLVYKSIKGRWRWPPPPPPSPCLPARVHEPTRVSLQGWTNGRLRDRWSNTLHTSLPVCNMSSSPATAVFPFRGNCRFSVIYIHPFSLSSSLSLDAVRGKKLMMREKGWSSSSPFLCKVEEYWGARKRVDRN